MQVSAMSVLYMILLASVPTQATASANPIRRIVALLQKMSDKVEAEGEKTDELFEKFLCYCKAGQSKSGKAIEDAEEKIPQVTADIKSTKELESQLHKEIEGHKADRTEAEAAIEKAKAIREKEGKAFAAESGEAKANIAALAKAIPAIEKGMGGAFIQTQGRSVQRLSKLFSSDADLSPGDRDAVRSFLQGEEISPGSGEIVGILKQQKDTMEKELVEMTQEEEAAVSDFQALVAANQKVIAGATKAIESKTARVGETAVSIVNLEEDLDDTTKGLAEEKEMLATLNKECDVKTKDHEAEKKMRQEELVAIADTIKLLNEDDASALFQKVLPSADSFLQISQSSAEVRSQAVHALRSTVHHATHDYRMNIVLLAMKGKAAGFEKVLKMLDDMVALLNQEQKDDDQKKEYCAAEIDKAEDEIKVLKGHIGDLEAAIDETKEGLGTVMDDIKTLTDSIVALDRSVAEATAQRKKEHAEAEKILTQNNAAIQLVEKAKNRMQKFYNPKLAKFVQLPAETEDSSADSFLQVSARTRVRQPEAFSQTGYQKKSEEAGGVLQMMDMMKADLEKESQEVEFEEKDSQTEYEAMVKEAAAKRAVDKKAIQSKEAAKAKFEEQLLGQQKESKSRTAEKTEAVKYLSDLMGDCQFLQDNYDARKEARGNEIEGLKKAKAVLQGADYSLVQTSTRHHLRKVTQVW